jgi:hypothetical protein
MMAARRRFAPHLAAGLVALGGVGVAPAALHAQTRLVIVSGLGGEKKYSTAFNEMASQLADAAVKRWGLPDADAIWLGEDSVAAGRPHYRGPSTKANVEQTLTKLAAQATPGEQVVVVLIGHGSGEGEQTKISLPGPDISARDFAQLLARFSTQRVAFVNLTSASGDMLPVLSGPNRVVITATKSAFERNESKFARFFVDALSKDGADADKDDRVSLLEAFRYAAAETKRFYENETKLQTEHAQFDDMGMKEGVAEPDGREKQGLLARRFFLDGGMSPQLAANDPRLAALYKEKFAIEDQIDQLRAKKTTMTADAYDDALETLLVNLARKARTIRELEGRKS